MIMIAAILFYMFRSAWKDRKVRKQMFKDIRSRKKTFILNEPLNCKIGDRVELTKDVVTLEELEIKS